MTFRQKLGIGWLIMAFLFFGLLIEQTRPPICISGRVYFPEDKDRFVDTAALCAVSYINETRRIPSSPQRDGDRDYVECTCPK